MLDKLMIFIYVCLIYQVDLIVYSLYLFYYLIYWFCISKLLKNTFECLDDKCFSTVFKSLDHPHIEYTNQVWSLYYLLKHVTVIENVQCQATKLIPWYKELDY